MPKVILFNSLFKWAVTGGFTFFIDFVIFVSLFKVTNLVAFSNLVSTVVSLIFNYLGHQFWSFDLKQRLKSTLAKYVINSMVFWLFSTLILKLLIMNQIDPRIAKVIPILLLALPSFYSLKRFVFSAN